MPITVLPLNKLPKSMFHSETLMLLLNIVNQIVKFRRSLDDGY